MNDYHENVLFKVFLNTRLNNICDNTSAKFNWFLPGKSNSKENK